MRPDVRRAQSVRHYTRATVTAATTGTDDLGVLKEVSEESSEVTLRRQLLEKDRENDKVRELLNFSSQRIAYEWRLSCHPRSSGIRFRHCRRSFPTDHQ